MTHQTAGGRREETHKRVEKEKKKHHEKYSKDTSEPSTFCRDYKRSLCAWKPE